MTQTRQVLQSAEAVESHHREVESSAAELSCIVRSVIIKSMRIMIIMLKVWKVRRSGRCYDWFYMIGFCFFWLACPSVWSTRRRASLRQPSLLLYIVDRNRLVVMRMMIVMIWTKLLKWSRKSPEIASKSRTSYFVSKLCNNRDNFVDTFRQCQRFNSKFDWFNSKSKSNIDSTRSLGPLRGPTSSWRPFGPAWLRPSRPSGAQAVWPTPSSIRLTP